MPRIDGVCWRRSVLKFLSVESCSVYREGHMRARPARKRSPERRQLKSSSGHRPDENMIGTFLSKLESRRDLSRVEAECVMEELLEGRLAHAEVVSFLSLLRAKGETAEELVGCARAMRRHVLHVMPPSLASDPLVDTCGTGGDGGHTFNVSTAAAFV